MVFPYIDMNQPWVYMCSPSWTPSHLPPHPIPQGHPSAPARSTLSHASLFKCHSVRQASHEHPSEKKELPIFFVMLSLFSSSIYLPTYLSTHLSIIYPSIHPSIIYLFNYLFFSSFRFMVKLRRRYRDFPSHTASPIINIPHQSGRFITSK